jgi:hypothetical protein
VWAVLFAHPAAHAHSKIPAPHSSLPTRWISLSLSLSLSLQMPAAGRLLFSPVFFFFFFFCSDFRPPSDFHYTTGVLTTLVSTTKATET